MYSRQAFTVSSPTAWNSLPKHLRDLSRSTFVFLLFLDVFSKHFFSFTTKVYSALEALAMMRYISLRFTLHYITLLPV